MFDETPLATKPLPGEFSFGHAGRIHRLNALPIPASNLVSFLNGVCKRLAPASPVSAVHSLAKLSGLDAVEYGKAHTLLPFHAFACSTDELAEPEKWPLHHVRKQGISASKRSGYWCSACATHDRSNFDFSYWRREHQVPGVLFCGEHDAPLHEAIGRDSFLRFPHECGNSMRNDQAAEGSWRFPLQRRYEAVAREMLRGPQRPLHELWNKSSDVDVDAPDYVLLKSFMSGGLLPSSSTGRLVSKAWECDMRAHAEQPTWKRQPSPTHYFPYGAPRLATSLAARFEFSTHAIALLRHGHSARPTSSSQAQLVHRSASTKAL